MPMVLLRSFVEAMGMLDAQEKLSEITTTAISFGNLTKIDSSRLITKLKRAASDSAADSVQFSRKVDPATLASIGIGFEIGKKEPPRG